MTIEAVPTWYGGTTFRSRLEANWAATLDRWAIRWEYEPETITLPSGTVYIPDFWLPELRTWIEVKGTGVPRVEKAIELGETRACRCDDDCACEWPGGQLVLIGHPPAPYYYDTLNSCLPYWAVTKLERHHGGHPKWSSAHGHTAWLLGHCHTCHRAGWTTDFRCRACGGRGSAGSCAYRSEDPALRFASHDACDTQQPATEETTA